MNRFIGGTMVLILVMLAGAGRPRAEILGLRGATWGELRYEVPKEGPDNLVLDGWVKQGLDVLKWGNTSLNTYAKLRYKWDSEGLPWNNVLGPTIGISLDSFVTTGLSGSLGMEYAWEQQDAFRSGGFMDQKFIIYANWYGWWDLKH